MAVLTVLEGHDAVDYARKTDETVHVLIDTQTEEWTPLAPDDPRVEEALAKDPNHVRASVRD